MPGLFRHIAIALILAAATVPPAAAAEVDLEIVLAVDASGSVDAEEFRLQLDGIAAAFRDPDIHRAILSGPHRKVAVALLIWADAAFPKYASEWHVLTSPETASRFAGIAAGFEGRTERSRGIGGGGTAIGDGLATAMKMIDDNGIEAARRVVDISGDGIETPPWFGEAVVLPEARQIAAARGVMVNGLAILNDFPRLDDWYRRNVIVGPGSFVIAAADFSDFRRAIKEKLWRELVVVVGGL